MTGIVRHDFASRPALAEALADSIAGILRMAIKARGKAVLAVSGGTTPALFFQALSRADLAWSNVLVTLVDERFVPEDNLRSNAGLVRARLLQDKAARARFIGLAGPGDLDHAAQAAEAGLRLIGLPLDVAVLGMGNDGHTASFFPDARELPQLLDPENPRLIAPVHAPSAGEARLTMTLPAIVSARFVALHIEGADKQATLKKAMSEIPPLPIRRAIDALETPIEIYWAP